MKIFRIFFICFFILYITTVIWIRDDERFDNIYWLIGELVGALILLVGLIFTRYNSKEETKISTFFSVIVAVLFCGYIYFYKPIVEYKRNIYQDKFGRAFNKTRQTLGIPQIPGDWKIRFRTDQSVDWWKSENDTIGHVSKYIGMDSVAKIKYEEDEYNFKSIKGVSSNLSITTYYKNDKVDSIVYYFEPGNNNNHKISRQQADSILASEKIKKNN